MPSPLLAIAALSMTIQPGWAEPEAAQSGSDAPRVYRVEGDPETYQVSIDGDLYRSGASFTEAALPEGYPAPTPPGALEIKTYPSVRRAQVSGEGGMNPSAGQGFFPLFNHIKKNDIAMTAPVEMIYAGEHLPEPQGDSLETHTNHEGDSWTMSFLYRTSDLGPTGMDGRVEIIDAEPVTVLSLGVRGWLSEASTIAGVTRLTAWIESSGHYEIAGHARTMGYNGPYVPRDIQWWEIQIPIRPIETQTETESETEFESNEDAGE